MIYWLRKTTCSFSCAISGLLWFIREERNARIHLVAALGVTAAGLFFHVTSCEWCVITLCIGAVFAAEMLNTAIERFCDHVTLQREKSIRRIKDVSAGAVLVISLAAAVAGFVIFLPRIGSMLPR